ncbi:unnamed protein product [Allacma fusca]|uniref:Fatty acid synthase n=1 Tax=Allacma fusca TaxID=39272 RepID=A0A8J2KTR9_9HEXA|nr:unnamed protein product [Allacma fusca]
MDSGIDPKTLSGAQVGVFMASTGMEAFEVWLRSTEYRTGHYITGCHVCMLADRISYAFNFKGPSCVFDSGCSASFSALQYALLALKNGLCDSAIVAGANINNIPFLSSAFFNFKALSADGKCKVFDASADGFVRSEAVVAIYICRKDCAKRLYSTILGVKCLNDGYKQEGISVPSWECQAKIMKEVYAEARVNPLDVNYIEAHGTGTKVGDPNEIAALADTFCSGRVEPLLVGSVKSNMGHAEPASGLCGIVKVLLSRRSRVIPPNLHFQTPNPECKALVDGRIKVVVEATPFQGCLVGINSFGIGGTTGHAILKFEDIDAVPANMCQIKTDEVLGFRSVMRSQSDAIPTLILASGRTKESLKYLLNQTSKVSKNRDFVGLLQEIAGAKTPKHKFLGFTLNGNTDFKLTTATRPESPRTLCYVYTGLGSQWLGISKALLKFRAFNASIQLSEKCLKNFGLDLESVFQTEDTRFVNTLQNAFVAITACQIALTDILMSINIYSDMMVGQSLGEELAGSHGIKFLINSSIDEFYAGHVIQGRILFPATGYICLAWKALAKLHGTNIDYFPIHLENIHFKRMTILQENKGVEFIVNVLNESGQFEIIESTEIVCTGTIRKAHRMDEELFSTNVNDSTLENYLESEDFYHLLFLRGYNYQGLFRGIQKIAMGGTRANINWNDNWICLLDTMIQTYILSMCSSLNELGVPVQLNSVTIFPTMFRDNLDRNTTIVNVCKFTDVVECHGIQLCGLNASMISRVTTLVNPTVATQKFVPFFETHEVVSETAVFEFFVGIAVENVDIFSESFIFTDVRDIILSVSINLQPLVYHKFKFYEHRIVINEHTTQSEDILPNSQMFVTIKELKYLSPSNLVWTNKESEIPACMELLNDNGFLIITSASQITCDLCLIAQHCTDSHYVYLFRKQYGFLQKPEVVSLDVPEFGWVEILKERLMSNNHLNRVYILSRSEISGIIGFANCLLKEPGMQKIRCLYIKNSPNVCTEQILNDELLKKDLVIQVCCNGSWGTYTNININEPEVPKNSDHAYASIKTIGDLSTLCWVESSCKLHQKSNYEVYFASLNFKDILLATGKLSKSAFADQLDGYLGLEFSGTYRNRRVCGISSGNCLASVLDCKPRMIWDVPEHWSLSEAATVPIVYATVLYALVMRGRVTKGETILIHSGSGGVGLAAITIALELNCVVFTTVGSNKKREFLKTKFSELPEERILNNQNGEKFKREILRQTNGIGVDVVLNSLALDQLKASLHCLSKGGRFLEIGKVDSVNNSAIGLAVLLKDIDIQGVHLDKVISSQSKRMLHLQSLLQEYLNKGKLKPLPFKCFGQEHLEDAFRYFASRQHVGKVIIKVRESCGTTNIAALPRSYFSPQKTYIIIGGLGGMGLEIVTWMITRGARRIFVVSRSGVSTTYQKYMMKSWETFGATIFMRHTDISNRKEVSKLIMEAISICPLGGVFNLALVLQDALFSNQTAKAFEMVSNSKATATLHFDALTRLYAPSMDYFVVFSSLACGKGNAGQSNYGYANSAMERICEQRIQDGFPARAIQWGVVADVDVLCPKLERHSISDDQMYKGINIDFYEVGI